MPLAPPIDSASSVTQLRVAIYGRILVPVDGSATSLAGVHEAIRMAKQILSPLLRLVYVADNYYMSETFDRGTIGGTILESMRMEGQKILKDAVGVLAANGLTGECCLVDSQLERADRGIIREAATWPADVIVMGSHGRRGIARWTLGSTAEAVARASPVPVLLVRAVV